MSGTVNLAVLVGRVGRQPEVRRTVGGTPVANFSLATDEGWKDKDGTKHEKTEWHQVTAWGRLAEICGEYLEKGRLVAIQGKLQTREWEGQDGGKRRVTEIVAERMQMLSSGGGSSQASAKADNPAFGRAAPQQQTEAPEGMPEIDDDDIPF